MQAVNGSMFYYYVQDIPKYKHTGYNKTNCYYLNLCLLLSCNILLKETIYIPFNDVYRKLNFKSDGKAINKLCMLQKTI